MIEYRREKAAVAAYDEDKRIGECTFTVENDVWNLEHTFVDKAYGGQGIAGKLVDGVCEAAREEGAFVRPVCSYAVHLFEKKPDIYSSVSAYDFYGWRSSPVHPVGEGFKGVKDQKYLYALLKKLWKRETCAPRLRDKWSAENPTVGQCSITAFLAQDIFGGEVRGIVLPDGSHHCFNAVGSSIFDLTSEQFGDTVLDYGNYVLESREEHFAKEEKRLRYEALKSSLLAFITP